MAARFPDEDMERRY